MNKLQLAAKGLSLLEMTERERRMVSFLIEHGYRMTWKNTADNWNEVLAFYMGWNEISVCKALSALQRRGWIDGRYLDPHGQHWVQLNQAYLHACTRAIQTKQVRTHLGIVGWTRMQPTPAEVAGVISKALSLDGGTLSQRLKWVCHEVNRLRIQLDCNNVTELLAALADTEL